MRNYIGFGPVVKGEMSFKDIYIYSCGGHFVQWSGTIRLFLALVAILFCEAKQFVQLTRNIPVKLFLICCLKMFLCLVLVAILFSRSEPFVQFW